MMPRPNKATISDTDMGENFQKGFREGFQRMGIELVYQLSAFFEGTELRRLTFKDLDTALAEAKELLRHGVGTAVTIMVYPESTPQMTTPQAVEDGVEDAEIVEDPH